MSRNRYSASVSNSFLKVSKKISGESKQEVQRKAQDQIAKWNEQMRRQREREQRQAERDALLQEKVENRQEAEKETEKAKGQINIFKSLLPSSLDSSHRLDWESLKDQSEFGEDPPSLVETFREMSVPQKSEFFESMFPSLKGKRLEGEAFARRIYEHRKEKYEEEKRLFDEKREKHNEDIDHFRATFEAGETSSVERYVYIVLERSIYPEGFIKTFDVQYDPASFTVVIAYDLPTKKALPQIVGYKYVASKNAVEPLLMKPKELDTYYEDCLYQICLRTIHEVFDADYTGRLKSVVFNGWVKAQDAGTGNTFHSCVLSCRASRQEFETYNLKHVTPKECFRTLKGISAGPLAQLAPVRPILNINREDSRFIEAKDVLSQIDTKTNLALMDWGEFEQLVRQLFENVFCKGGGEVQVTQASRDGGVDAIAFDPDPIRGGKFVIQAKRYNNVVPVSAVRDLYGTMIAEGATKGILVTTSYYGDDTREFAKDKPITLIDGSNLVYMFREYGYDVSIQLQTKERSGLGNV